MGPGKFKACPARASSPLSVPYHILTVDSNVLRRVWIRVSGNESHFVEVVRNILFVHLGHVLLPRRILLGISHKRPDESTLRIESGRRGILSTRTELSSLCDCVCQSNYEVSRGEGIELIDNEN